jgi:HSP20 family protein
MTMMRRPSPFGELLSLRQAMDRLFEDSFVNPRGAGASLFEGGSMPVDVSTTDDELVVEASLPGAKPEEVDITVEAGTLTIGYQSATERKENKGDYLVQEIRRGSFSRSITLPNGLEPDKASATFENGILRLRIPKAEQVKPRQIRISPVSPGRAIESATNQSNEQNPGGSANAERIPVGAGNRS